MHVGSSDAIAPWQFIAEWWIKFVMADMSAQMGVVHNMLTQYNLAQAISVQAAIAASWFKVLKALFKR